MVNLFDRRPYVVLFIVKAPCALQRGNQISSLPLIFRVLRKELNNGGTVNTHKMFL